MERGYFEHDCNGCQALCCTVTVRTRPEFASDDRTGQTCRHLAGNFRCLIHHKLKEAGFPECMPYRCHSVGNRLTRILRIADVPDMRKPQTGRKKEVVRVVSQIFKDIESTMSLLEGFLEKKYHKEFWAMQQVVEEFFQEIEDTVRNGGNIYVMIPRAVEIYAKLRSTNKEIAEREGIPLLLGRYPATSEQGRALSYIMKFAPAEIPQETYERILAGELGPSIPNPEKLRKYIFALYQLAWSFYKNPIIWEGVTEEDAIKISNEAATIYAGYEDSDDDFHLPDIARIIFPICIKTEFREETVIQVR